MHIQIKKFSGPLDLLLQLIRREEMDIFDIDIHKITEQYLIFVEGHSIPDLDSAGDFIRMAALLIYIKSKSLFPAESQVDPELESEVELQKKLVQSLLKMQAVQNICRKFNQYHLLNRDIWSSGGKAGQDLSALFPELQEAGVKQQPILKLMRAYRRVFQQAASSRPLISLEDPPLPFLADCIRSIHYRLIAGASLKMSSLIRHIEGNILSQNLVTFLALLELNRLGIVSLEQKKDYSDIVISVKKQFSDKDFHFIHEMEGGRMEERIGIN